MNADTRSISCPTTRAEVTYVHRRKSATSVDFLFVVGRVAFACTLAISLLAFLSRPGLCDEKSATQPIEKSAEKPVEKVDEKPADGAPDKPADKPAGKPAF